MDRGEVYVTRIKYEAGKAIYPEPPQGATKIVVMMKSHSKKWFPLSPYDLKTKEGYLIENYWQFQKLFEIVPKTKEFYSRFDKTVIWEWHNERHALKSEDSGDSWEILPQYYKWREAGFNNRYPVRYPTGYHNRKNVLFFVNDEGKRFNYSEARQNIYLPAYTEAVKKTNEYHQLLKKVKQGEDIAIFEVDGPHQESLDYYKQKYDVDDDFIAEDSILVTNENMEIMMNDTKHSFGHGYCLGWSIVKDLS